MAKCERVFPTSNCQEEKKIDVTLLNSKDLLRFIGKIGNTMKAIYCYTVAKTGFQRKLFDEERLTQFN